MLTRWLGRFFHWVLLVGPPLHILDSMVEDIHNTLLLVALDKLSTSLRRWWWVWEMHKRNRKMQSSKEPGDPASGVQTHCFFTCHWLVGMCEFPNTKWEQLILATFISCLSVLHLFMASVFKPCFIGGVLTIFFFLVVSDNGLLHLCSKQRIPNTSFSTLHSLFKEKNK